ncbi:Long-chain-fatty-acid--CoA ligase [anaerobic digester metagenome]|jgi:long-chain acyl-CoA synthetase|nr:AMP-binding protein [Bacteroidales bacterium]MBP9584659.1 AMP-binding protein [Bacteroidales bacterium]
MISEVLGMSLADIYTKSLIDFKERDAFSTIRKERLTYGQFGERVERLTELLNKHGINKGEKVVILGNNMPNWAVSYFAITTSARVAVPILPDFTAFEIANVIEHSEATVIIVSEKLHYKLSKNILESFTLVVNMDSLEVVSAKDDLKYVVNELPDPSDVANIIYTSGTSGTSKGVTLSHRNLVSQNYMANRLLPMFKEDVFLSILPLSHAYECSLGLILPFSRGAQVVYLDGAPTPSLLLPALAEVKPTIMLSVPLIVEKLYKNKIRPMFTKNWIMQVLYSIHFIRRALHKIAGKKLCQTFGGRLRFFGIGGSKLDGVVERFLADAGFPYGIGYGLTETSPLLAGAIPGKVTWQSTGPQLPDIEMKILNPNKKGIGEIVVKGPNVMIGYYKDPDTTATCFTEDGWFRTKDLGYIDKKGNLYIKGRKDNMIVGPNGENIYPEEIEAVINEHDLVLESLVINTKGKLTAMVHYNYEQIEKLHTFNDEAIINMEQRVSEVKKELLEYVNSRVNKSSRILDIIEQAVPFEKTATQKIKRYLYS